MLTKRFKSNKFYKVDRSFFKYGHDYDGNYDETPGTIYYLNNKKSK